MAINWHDGDIIRATAKMDYGGDDIQNVFHYRYNGPDVVDTTAISSVLAAIDNIYDNFEPAMNTGLAFTTIDITNVTQGLVYPDEDWPNQTTGGDADPVMPNQCCLMMLGRTNRSKTLARKFMGPFTEGDHTGNAWVSGLVSSAGTALVDWLTGYSFGGGSQLSPVVVHYVNNAINRVSDILTGVVTDAVYTQRRRRKSVGS